jgi:hypothetical protein
MLGVMMIPLYWSALIPALFFGIFAFATRKQVQYAGGFVRWMPRVACIAWQLFSLYEIWMEQEYPHAWVRFDLFYIFLLLFLVTIIALYCCLLILGAAKPKHPTKRSSDLPSAGAAGSRSP